MAGLDRGPSLAGRLWRALWWRLRCRVELVRARASSRTRLRERCPRRLLVLCYGNIYRSAFVTAYIGREFGVGGSSPAVRCAGFHPVAGRPSPPAFITLARSYGVNLEDHRSRVVEPDDLEWAEAVVIMDRHNWQRLAVLGPAVRDKVVWLGALSSRTPIEIVDPYKRSPEQVHAIVEQMRWATGALVQALRASVEQTR